MAKDVLSVTFGFRCWFWPAVRALTRTLRAAVVLRLVSEDRAEAVLMAAVSRMADRAIYFVKD